jgi:hypothetical protein
MSKYACNKKDEQKAGIKQIEIQLLYLELEIFMQEILFNW